MEDGCAEWKLNLALFREDVNEGMKDVIPTHIHKDDVHTFTIEYLSPVFSLWSIPGVGSEGGSPPRQPEALTSDHR